MRTRAAQVVPRLTLETPMCLNINVKIYSHQAYHRSQWSLVLEGYFITFPSQYQIGTLHDQANHESASSTLAKLPLLTATWPDHHVLHLRLQF